MRYGRAGWLFVTPWLVGFSLLTVYPFLASLYWSFCEYDLLGPPKYVGVQHYRRLGAELLAGEGLGSAIWNTGYYALISVPLTILMGISLASMLSWRVRGQSPSYPPPSSGCGCSIQVKVLLIR